MEKYIFDESNGLWYEFQGEYYIPCLTVPEDEQSIGIWGQRHLQYIKAHKKHFYTALLLRGTLNSHLADVDARAYEMLNRLTRELAEKEGITEQLKAQDQMLWIRSMNNIRNAAEEIVKSEVIFV